MDAKFRNLGNGDWTYMGALRMGSCGLNQSSSAFRRIHCQISYAKSPGKRYAASVRPLFLHITSVTPDSPTTSDTERSGQTGPSHDQSREARGRVVLVSANHPGIHSFSKQFNHMHLQSKVLYVNAGDQGQITAIRQNRAKEAPEDSTHFKGAHTISVQCQLQLSPWVVARLNETIDASTEKGRVFMTLVKHDTFWKHESDISCLGNHHAVCTPPRIG